MSDSMRRVRRLRLGARDRRAVDVNVDALRDAFRIASLPGIPPHGMLLIKRFDLGKFPTHSSPLLLSRLIDDRIRTLSAAAVCADTGEHGERDLVWFSDAAEAAICLAERVAANREPRAWYWKLAFPSWREGMNLAQTLAAIAADIHGEPAAHVVLARVTERRLERASIAAVLGCIDAHLAQSLLREAGFFGGPVAAASDTAGPAADAALAELPPDWAPLVERAVAAWGSGDARCLWFAYCALTTHNPALAGDPGFPEAVRALVANRLAPVTGQAAAPSPLPHRAANAPPSMNRVTDGAPADADLADTPRAQVAPHAAPGATPPAQGATSRNPAARHRPAQRTESTAIRTAAPPIGKAAVARAGVTTAAAEIGAASAEDSLEKATAGHEGVTASHAADDGDATAPYRSPAAAFGGVIECAHCGLPFLLSLLDRLSIKTLLESNPALTRINLPARVLLDIGRRLRVADDHPLLRALPELPTPVAEIDDFVSPDGWRPLLASPKNGGLSLRRFDTTASGSDCYLTDRSGLLLLYAGRADLPRWTRTWRIERQQGRYPRPTPADLSRTLQLLMARYLRRHAGMSLRQVVERGGRIASTRTHLDVLFALRQTDIRIRKSGLDINPGWVAWLGRVVQFHYDDGETVDV